MFWYDKWPIHKNYSIITIFNYYRRFFGKGLIYNAKIIYDVALVSNVTSMLLYLWVCFYVTFLKFSKFLIIHTLSWSPGHNPCVLPVEISLQYPLMSTSSDIFVFNSGHRNQVISSLLGGFSKPRAEVIQLLDSGLCSI